MKNKKMCQNCGYSLHEPRSLLRQYPENGAFCIGNYDSKGAFIMGGKMCDHEIGSELGTPVDSCFKCDTVVE